MVIINDVDGIIADRFEIIDELGEGGMGKVWLATDKQTGKLVAFKLLMEFSKDRQSRFEREVQTIKAMRHESIVKFVASGVYNDLPYMVTDFVAGRPISHEDGLEKNLVYALKIIDVLDYIHDKGIVHRDIKPTNIIVAGDQAILMDFGVALDINLDRLTTSGNIVGTVSYMSPEQLYGQVLDNRTDIYSIGIVLYELITGKHPFQALHFPDIVSMITTGKPENPHSLNKDIPQELSRIVMKALEKNPANRYQSALEFKNDLQGYLEGAKPDLPNSIDVPEKNRLPFLGRDKELQDFSSMILGLKIGKGFSCDLNGPVGIGKTALLEQVKSLSLSKSVRFINISQDNTVYEMPALSCLFDQLATYDLLNCDTKLLKAVTFELRQYSPSFADKAGLEKNPPRKDTTDNSKIFARIVASCFQNKPVIVAFEDNIDKMTHAVATELAELARNMSIGVILVTSDDKASRHKQLPVTKTIGLEPLSDNQISELAELIIGNGNKKMVNEIAEKSKGFPLVCVSLASQLSESSDSKALRMLNQATTYIYAQAYDNLSKNSKSIVEVLTLATFPTNLEHLQAILGLDTSKMIECVMELRKSGLTVERFNGLRMQYEIASPVVRWSITKKILKEDKQHIHLLIAQSHTNPDVKDDLVFRCEAAKHFIDCGEPNKAIEVILCAAQGLIEAGRTLIAEKYFRLILPFICNIDNDKLGYSFFMDFGDTITHNRSIIDISPLIMIAYKIIKSSQFSGGQKLDLILCMTRLSNSVARYDIMREFAEYGLKYIDRSSTNESVAELHMHIAFTEMMKPHADTKRMLKYAKSSVLYAQKSKKMIWIAKTTGMYATCLSEASQHKEVNPIFEQAISTFRELDDSNALMTILYNYSISLITQNSFADAVKACKEMIEIAKDLESIYHLSMGMHGLIRCHTALQNFQEAALVCDEMLELASRVDPAKAPPRTYLYPCEYELAYQKLDILKENANKLLDVSNVLGDVFYIANAKYYLAELAYIKQDYPKSLEILLELKHEFTLDTIYSPETLLGNLSKSYSANGQFSEALEMLDELASYAAKQDEDSERKKMVQKAFFASESIVYSKIISSKNYSYEVKKRIIERTKIGLKAIPQPTQIMEQSLNLDFVPPFRTFPETTYGKGLTLLNAKHLDIGLDEKLIKETLTQIESTMEYMLKHKFKRLWNELTALRVEIMKVFNL